MIGKENDITRERTITLSASSCREPSRSALNGPLLMWPVNTPVSLGIASNTLFMSQPIASQFPPVLFPSIAALARRKQVCIMKINHSIAVWSHTVFIDNLWYPTNSLQKFVLIYLKVTLNFDFILFIFTVLLDLLGEVIFWVSSKALIQL